MPQKLPPISVRRKVSEVEIGDSAGISLNGIIVSNDFNAKLTGSAGIKIWDQMRKSDATVRASMLAVKLPILSARWYVEPASESRQDRNAAAFIEQQFNLDGETDGMTRTWQEFMWEALLYLDYGRMPFEIVYTFTDEEMIGLKKISPRYPDTIWRWKTKDGGDGITQRTVNGEFEVPIDKMVIFVNQKEGENWEGNSMLRTAYKHWYMKDKLYLIDAIASERQGLGIPKAEKPIGATDKDVDKVEELLQNLRANERGYLIHPAGWKIDFMDMKAGTNKNLWTSISHHDRQIVKNVLAQFLELGANSVGSFALSQDQSKLFLLSLEAVANYVRDSLQKFVVKKLCDYNYDLEKYPKLKFDKIGSVDHNMLSTTLQRLSQIGAITKFSQNDIDYLRDIMDMPADDGTEDIDLSMFDDMFSELEQQIDPAVPEPTDPAMMTPEEQAQMQQDNQQAMDQIETWNKTNHGSSIKKHFGSEVYSIVLKGGPAGVPLSEETKRKISEALSKGKGKGKGKAKDAESEKIKSEIRKLKNDVKLKLLEMKARGEKIDPQEQAKMQLDIFKKQTQLEDRIAKVKSAQAAQPAPTDQKTASDQVILKLKERVDKALEAYEPKSKA